MTWFEASQEYLGTEIHLTFESETDLSASIWSIAETLEQKFSRFRRDSELTVFNQALNTWHKIDDEWRQLLQTALDLKSVTSGALDLTTTTVLESWGYDADYSLKEKEQAGELGIIELGQNKFKASAPIDFGSIGKGYFLDLVKAFLINQGVESFFINAGGDIYAQGLDCEKNPWKVFFEDPRKNNLVIGELVLDKTFACASSPAQRQWRDRHHLVDTETLAPAGDMMAVYVQSTQSGAYCDGLSTGLFVMGFEKAKNIITTENLAAMIIGVDSTVWKSTRFQGAIYID